MLHGGQISRRQTIFSADGKLLCAPCGNNIRLYGASTSECVGTLEGHTDEVTCLALNPKDSSQVSMNCHGAACMQSTAQAHKTVPPWHVCCPC